jgi:hypothetical protein
VEKIHLHVGLDQVEAVYAKAKVELALKMPAVTVKTFEKLGVTQDFFIHDASLIRLMMPFDIMKTKQKEFQKHLGKLTLHGPTMIIIKKSLLMRLIHGQQLAV